MLYVHNIYTCSLFPRCILICVVFLTGPEVLEVLCVPSSSSQQASGVNFNFVMTMVSTLKMHVTHNWSQLIVGTILIL